MRKVLCAGLFALPFVASAAPVAETKTLVDVEVWARVRDVQGDRWSVNDSLYKRLTIDTSLAPPDLSSSPQTGSFDWNDTSCEPDCPPRVPAPSGFIRTQGSTFEGISDDAVGISDQTGSSSGSYDLYSISDSETLYGPDGRLQTRASSFHAVLISPNIDFIHGDSITQSFDVTVPRFTDSAGSSITELIDGVFNSARLFVTRMRTTVRVCRP